MVELDVCLDDLCEDECLCVLFDLVGNFLNEGQGFSFVLRYCNHWCNDLDQAQRVQSAKITRLLDILK